MSGNFLDTNILLYVLSSDLAKAERAAAILREGGTVSVQVLNEFAHVAHRKMEMSWGEVRSALETVRALVAVRPLTPEIHQHGITLAERHGFSLWDAMVVASAIEAGCDRLWSEDFQNGMEIDHRLTIANPFSGR